MNKQTRLDGQLMALQVYYSIKDVLQGNLPGQFSQESKRQLESLVENFDLDNFLKESNSYGDLELEQLYRTSLNWLSLLNIDPVNSRQTMYNPINAHFESITGADKDRGHLVVIDEELDQDRILPSNDIENNYWLLTDDGYLEFHGGGYLRNSHGEIMSEYNGAKPIGNAYIESGLDVIINKAAPNDGKGFDRSYIINMMCEAGLNYRTKNPDNINNSDGWRWDIKENLTNNAVRRIKLPESVAEYYKQFEPSWEKSGQFGQDYSSQTNGSVKYHLGQDWVLRMNNRNETTKVNVHSVYDGEVVVAQNLEQPGLGKWVSIKTKDEDFYIQYMHLSEVKVSKGSVKKGDIIGIAGYTGLESGKPEDAHLHIAKCYDNNTDSEDILMKEGFTPFKQEDYDDGKEITSSSAIQNVRRDDGKIKNEGSLFYVIPPVPVISIIEGVG